MNQIAPKGYICPICPAIAGIENNDTWIVQDDFFYADDLVLGFISSKKIKGNENHPLIVPRKHYECIYDLPEELGHHVFDIAKQTALALKEVRNCDGVTIMQNNEPASSQHAFHYHMHVIPRFDEDQWNLEHDKAQKSDPEIRKQPATDLREWFKKKYKTKNRH